MLFKERTFLGGLLGTNDRNTDKGEVGGSSPPRPTIQIANKYAAILAFSLSRNISRKSDLPKICQKFQPFNTVSPPGWFRSFWTIRATGTIDSRVSPMRLQCTHAYGPGHFQLSVFAEAHCPDAGAQCNYRRERKWEIQPLSCSSTSCRHCTG
jgi:hypothetical protein